jgi:hypothetical protein
LESTHCKRVMQRGGTALLNAAEQDQWFTVAELVRLGADVNAPASVRILRHCGAAL